MVNFKSLIISKNKPLYSLREEIDEKNLSTQQYQTEKNAWFFGEDEHQGRSQCFKTEENEGEEKVNRLSERTVQVYKKREDQPSSGFQRGDENREEGVF